MATTNFQFTTLTGQETAGWNSINTLLTSIDTQLNSSNRLVYMSGWSAVSGQTIKWDAANSRWVPGTLDSAALANDSVTSAQIAANAVGSSEIASNAVGSDEISAGAVTLAKISPTGSSNGQVLTSTGSGSDPSWQNISSGSVTLAGDVTGAANANTIATGAVTSDKILNGTIVNADINASAAIEYSKLSLANSIVSADIVNNTITINDLATALQELLNPVGVIQAYIGTSAPSGWLLCNGDPVSRTTYSALWDLFRQGGSTSPYGNGDGSTTFNLPDLQGKTILGINLTYPRGTAGGGTASLTSTNLPAHTHTVSETSTGGTAYASIVNNTNFAAGSGIGQRAIVNTSQAGGLGGYEGLSSFGTSPNHTHSVSVSGGGNGTSYGTAFNTIPPYQTANYIIKF